MKKYILIIYILIISISSLQAQWTVDMSLLDVSRGSGTSYYSVDEFGKTVSITYYFSENISLQERDNYVKHHESTAANALRAAGVNWITIMSDYDFWNNRIYASAMQGGYDMSGLHFVVAPFQDTELPFKKERSALILFKQGAIMITQTRNLPSEQRVLINQVMYDSPLNEVITISPHTNGEFVELLNTSGKEIDLTGWKFCGDGKTEIFDFPDNTKMPDNSYIILAYKHPSQPFEFHDLYHGIFANGTSKQILYHNKIILANSGESLTLYDQYGTVRDSIYYDGTSNKTKPGRLSAENATGISGYECVCLQRNNVSYDETGRALFEPSDWLTKPVAPFGQRPKPLSEIVPSDGNYIIKTVYLSKDSQDNDKRVQEITYYDNLMRPEQSILMQGSSQGKDVVRFYEYDCMGRGDSISYLPFVTRTGGRKIDQLKTKQGNYYYMYYLNTPSFHDAQKPYSRTVYDNSPLSLKTSTWGPGEIQEDHPTIMTYRLNMAWDRVKKMKMAPNDRSLSFVDYYDDDILTVIEKQQQNLTPAGIITQEFYNSQGQVVAKRTISSNKINHTSYFVYDDMGRLRYTIPAILDDELTAPGDYSLEELTHYAYYKEYDKFGNVYKQFVPGADSTLAIYDRWGRLVMQQDGNLRSQDKWTFIKYDIYDRPIMSGVYTGGSYSQHATAIENSNISGEALSTTGIFGYTNNSYPIVPNESYVLSVSYYDTYPSFIITKPFVGSYAFDQTKSENIIGLPTVTLEKVLGNDEDIWLETVNYYDDQYRLIQVVSDIYPNKIEYSSNLHNFSGSVIKADVRQMRQNGQYEGYEKSFFYDKMGRLLTISQTIHGDTQNGEVMISEYSYDELGNVSSKSLHNGATTINYTYDLHKRNVNVISPHLQYSLVFDRSQDSSIPVRYDGLLSAFRWKNGPSASQTYEFSYDGLGQYLSADIYPGLSDEYTGGYDKNGNLRSIQRFSPSGDFLHNYQFQYNHPTNGNAVSSIDNSEQFEYDRNGNMTKDGLTGVRVEYNILNLPERIFDNTEEIRYIYSSSGKKLATETGSSLTFYSDVMVYSAQAGVIDQLSYIQHPEGITAKTSAGYIYQYHLTDHIGSTRVVLQANGKTLTPVQTTDYYPSGLAWQTNDLNINRYLFSGKELQDVGIGSTGMLGYYDFGSRFYNPMYGRWFNIDPALQFHNPYLYGANNPMMTIDPDGEFVFTLGAIIGIGAAIGAVGYTASVGFSKGGFNNWNWGAFGKAVGFGAVSGMFTYGIGGAFAGTTGFGMGVSQGIMHGGTQSIFSAMQGGHPLVGFATGAAGSWGASAYGLTGLGNTTVGTLAFGGIAGGLGSWATGGDFWQGMGTGLIIAGLNHTSGYLFDYFDKRHKTNQLIADAIRKSNLNGTDHVDLEDVLIGIKKLAKSRGKIGYSSKQSYIYDNHGNKIIIDDLSFTFGNLKIESTPYYRGQDNITAGATDAATYNRGQKFYGYYGYDNPSRARPELQFSVRNLYEAQFKNYLLIK